jgi:hypothetical protein
MNRTTLLLITLIAAIVGGGVLALSRPAPPPLAPPPSPPVTPSISPASPSSRAIRPNAPVLKIATCDGSPATANFRAFPSLAPDAILGVVTIGQSVQITDRPVRAEGVVWYPAVNLAPLAPASDAVIQNQTQARQLGWIASCFVRGSA